jgi:hypothetical protein
MSFLQRVVGTLLGILFVLALFVFASIALAVLLAVGLATWGWLWWRSRSQPRGHVIEGEFQRLEEQREQQRL